MAAEELTQSRCIINSAIFGLKRLFRIRNPAVYKTGRCSFKSKIKHGVHRTCTQVSSIVIQSCSKVFPDHFELRILLS
ncbi:hypothetical protein D3C74_267520 [compost metagenome]